MRRVFPLATMFLIASAALAQVEPRMAGDRRSGEESLGADGRYQKSLNSQNQTPAPSQSNASISGYNNQPLPAFPTPRPFKPLKYVAGPPTYPPGYKPLADPHPPSINPPGWRPPADHPHDRGPNQDSNGNWVNREYKKELPVQYVNAADIKPNGRRSNLWSFEQNANVQWQQRGQSPGYQRVPAGGYIPVMKDNKARSFWRGF